ncbi:MAG: hypothetical protein ACH6QP_01035 [Candidatus Carsonella ruddii]
MNSLNKNLIGFWLYIFTDCIMFSIIFISFLLSNNFLLKKIIFNYKILLIESILLLYCSYLSIIIINKNKNKYYYLNILFSTLFLILEYKDYYHLKILNITFTNNNYLSNYFLIIFFHALHVFISIIICINLFYIKYLNKKIKIINICYSLFWHFIHIIWLCLVLIIYLKK